ncbi:MAG: carboxypeptidase regulatory-like domain-containing protein [Chitinophagaceae bacterium]|nr:carboxypeptidase regulatory-like domain-containing protein [Chitinophagaceae bacterium]
MNTTYSVKGILQTAGHRPVENAIVMITEGDYEFPDIASVSNEKGEFYLSNIHLPGNYTLQINSEDTSFKRKFFITAKDTVLQVTM